MENEVISSKAKIKKPGSITHAEHDGVMHDDVLERNFSGLLKPMTYSKSVKENHDYMQLIKKPHWLFPEICHRKDQATLTSTEKQRFICAFNMINENGALAKLVDIHAEMHMQHSNARLLPWHRIFIYLFEEALHHCHPDVCLPYWDWENKKEQNFPSWLAAVLPTVHTPVQTIVVTRATGSGAELAADVNLTPTAMSQNNYPDFSAIINGIHGSVHMWVGGTMTDPETSPADPIFWLHHANLDRLWWKWYKSAAGNQQNPNLAGMDAVMDPWSYTEADTRNIAPFGYKYV